MGTTYVNSAAAGANNGTSWTDAYVSIASTTGVGAGEIIKCHYTHSETTLASNLTWANGTTANPVRIVSVNKDSSDALTAGALVGWSTGARGIGNCSIYTWGMTWRNSAGNLLVRGLNDGLTVHEGGIFQVTGNGSVMVGDSARVYQKWIDQDVDLSGAGAVGNCVNLTDILGQFEWIGGTYTCRGTQTQLFAVSGMSTPPIFRGLAFSGTVTSLVSNSGITAGLPWFDRCSLPTYTNVQDTATTAGHSYHTRLDSVTGTISAAQLNPVQYRSRNGTVKATTARYRTSGADDGSQANAYSYEMAGSSSSIDFVAPLISPAITRWVAAGSQALKIYVASGVTLQDDEFWIEVLSPSEAGSPTSQAAFRSTRAAALASPANLTTDGSSTWNGSGVGTKQYATVTIAPTIAGPVTIRVHLAKASTTVYVDPVIDVDANVAGKSRFFEGVQAFDFTDAGGGSNALMGYPAGMTGGNQKT